MRARAAQSPFKTSCRAYWLFVCAHRIVPERPRPWGPRPFRCVRKGCNVSCVTTLQELDLDPNIAARARALREGRALPELDRKFTPAARELGLHNAPDTYEGPPIAPLPPKGREFRSRPDAKPMSRSDIANVQFLNLDTARDILQEVAVAAPELAAKAREHVEANYRELLTDNERYALSAMAARKFMRELETV